MRFIIWIAHLGFTNGSITDIATIAVVIVTIVRVATTANHFFPGARVKKESTALVQFSVTAIRDG